MRKNSVCTDELGNKRNLAGRTGKQDTSGTNNRRLIYDRDLFGSREACDGVGGTSAVALLSRQTPAAQMLAVVYGVAASDGRFARKENYSIRLSTTNSLSYDDID